MQLSAENLYAGYGNKSILNGLSVTLPAGKITALIGPNGCGKSTLLKCFSRLLTPESGTLRLQGDDISRLHGRALARKLALLPQQHVAPEGIRVRELVGYGRSPWLNLWGRLGEQDHARVSRAMQETNIGDLAEKLVSELSGGQRQRVFLAMVLAQDTPLVLLDEPTTYLDISHQVELMNLLRRQNQQGKTVVAVLHDLNQASRYCDYLVMMAAGKIVAQGSPEAVMTPALLAQVFDIDAQIHPEPVSGMPMCIVK
ncbi:iron complex transport system ATP-binding protein [Rahnella sp. BIGb0603]|jgi:iron complex transport system ATP-binding protein|uniref:Fe(3+) dicitrate ABC transporter ATP-binding protein FecE n=1 Tax=Rahnella TaxID=34037 RepID=UPI001265FE20|nr:MULTISPECIES: Fe(3+) dicitrate ABC transporter ATP-binding protein FecE [Rahnella]KAB8307625.1 Fe(3+) dicitrate ABC transporter ATP-binding protein FecE [Rouxiella chamberiensis]MCS3424313.1 iron complex transport system ATP-binding protein [Rahnella sp. BIGb0603]MDF1895129.1 Fe(3+) dicitrate ABC transporter ATP-binding protein FecE [Rahnella contaminans]